MPPPHSTTPNKSSSPKDQFPIRLNLYLARTGITTRRGADRLITDGEVLVNGKKATLGTKISETDKVTIRESKTKTPYVYYAYNKPVGIVTTNPVGEEKDILQTTKFPTSVFPVGRLDKDSHGLIIMTNDGRVTTNLLSPEKDHEKEYVVKVDSDYNDALLGKLSRGVAISTYISKPAKTKRISPNTFSIILTEGKKRQIRRMVSVFRHFVVDLKRVRIENIRLGNIPAGGFKPIEGKTLADFLKKIGIQ